LFVISLFSISLFNLITGVLKFLAVGQAHCVPCLPTRDVWADGQTDHCPWGQRGPAGVCSNWFLCAYDASKDVFPVNIPTGRQRMGWPITNRDAVFNGVLTYKKIPFLSLFLVSGLNAISVVLLLLAKKSYLLPLHFEWR
jgi:hypothetical protein